MSPYDVAKFPSAIMLLDVNFGGFEFIDANHLRMASFPLPICTPTIVHSTSSAQSDRNPSTLPSAKAASALATISLSFSDICISPMFKRTLYQAVFLSPHP